MTTAELEQATDRQVQAATILEKSVVLTLSCHYFGNTRVVDVAALVDRQERPEALDAVEDGKALDLSQFRATKRLMDSRELRPVMRVLGETKRYLQRTAIPGHRVFGERSYLVPLALVETVDDELRQFERRLRAEADALALRYDAAVARQRIALGPQFREADYIGAAGVAAAFGLDWAYVSFAAPDRLETVSHVLARAAQRKHQQRLAQAYDEVLLGLRASALDVLRELADRLAPGDDGKARTLRSTALRDLQDFMATLPARDLTGDVELQRALADVSARAQGLDVQTLRDSAAAREALQAAARQAGDVLAELVQTGRRAISLGGQMDL